MDPGWAPDLTRSSSESLWNAAVVGDVSYFERRYNSGGAGGMRKHPFCDGNTMLHTHLEKRQGIGEADATPNPNFIKYVLEEAGQPLHINNDRGELVHHIAAKYGQVSAMKLLLQHGGLRYLLFPNKNGDTPVHLAINHSSPHDALSFITFLIHSDPQNEYIPRLFDERSLHLAMNNGSHQLFDLIFPYCSTPITAALLHEAISPRNSDMVKVMLKHKPELMESRDNGGRSLVHKAAERNDNRLLKKLLEDNHKVAYSRDYGGQTAVHKAAQHNNLEGLLILEKFAPDAFQSVDNQGRNPAHDAATGGHGWEVLEYLLKHFKFSSLFSKEDDKGNTAIHQLAISLMEIPTDHHIDAVTAASSLEFLRHRIIPQLHHLTMTAVNKDYQTPGDIAGSISLHHLDPPHREAVREFCRVAPRGQLSRPPPDKDVMDDKLREEKRASDALILKKMCYQHLGVAALIVTLCFSAFLAPPGGFDQNDQDPIKRGTVMLVNNTAFEVFSICNRVAWAFSATAFTFYYMAIASLLKFGLPTLKFLSFVGLTTSAISILVLMATAAASAYATQGKSGRLHSVKLVITLVPMFLYVLFLIYSFIMWRRFPKKKMPLSSSDKNC